MPYHIYNIAKQRPALHSPLSTLHSSLFTLLSFLFTLLSCVSAPEDAVRKDVLPPLYPDYADVTIPPNIAPLNFLLRDEAIEATYVTANGEQLAASSDNTVTMDESDWHALLSENQGKSISVTVYAKKDGRWTEYKPFCWTVASDSIDAYLTYRLIEPDYEVWHQLEMRERCVENFDERPFSTYKLTGDRCMNCHTYGGNSAARSMFYVRGEGGGAVLNENGHLRKLNLKAQDMVSGSVYFGFSPSGRYLTFSTNVIIPAFHAVPNKRLEVYDTKSDIYVADLQSHRFVRSPLLSDSTVLETFPTFSPDGRYIYYCAAPKPRHVSDLQYALCRIAFDETKGVLGTQVDTIVSANGPVKGKTSVCHPRVSPDGRYLLYTVASYGTFPIWHPEADLQLLDLQTGRTDTLAAVNSQKSDTYHSWSSNSRWFVFASKRDDGLYGKPYFCYIDRQGRAHKPFVLPQKDPHFYDDFLKSFNVPELGRTPLPFDATDVERALQKEAETFE